MKMQEKSLLGVIVEERMYTALEIALQEDAAYVEAKQCQENACAELEGLELTRGQKQAIDRLVSEMNLYSSKYGKAAYKQGFQDVVKLIFELKELF